LLDYSEAYLAYIFGKSCKLGLSPTKNNGVTLSFSHDEALIRDSFVVGLSEQASKYKEVLNLALKRLFQQLHDKCRNSATFTVNFQKFSVQDWESILPETHYSSVWLHKYPTISAHAQ